MAASLIRLDPSRLIFAEQLGCGSSDWLILEEVAGTAGHQQEARRGEPRIGHHQEAAQEVARSTGQEAARSTGQEAARSIAQEAARNTRIGQRQAARSGDRQRHRIRRRAQQKAVGP